MKIHFFLFLALTLLIACKSNKRFQIESHDDHHHHGNSDWYSIYEEIDYSYVQDSCRINCIDDSFKDMLYDFNFKGFNSKQIAKSFSDNVSIDSLVLEDVPGYPYYLYRFHDKVSRFNFLVKSFGADEYYFIDRAQLSSSLVKFRNGLNIGMTKEQFSLAMGYKIPICDIFRVSDGDLASDYDFIFTDNKLVKIIIWEAH